MSKVISSVDKINIIGCIADIKDINYQNILTLSALIELLISKEVISRDEFETMCVRLDSKLK